jgi:hypothetical protein
VRGLPKAADALQEPRSILINARVTNARTGASVTICDTHEECNPSAPAEREETTCAQDIRQHILLILDSAPNHTSDDLAIPAQITLEFLPPYSPELNPQENIWDGIREKIFKNYAFKSMDEVCDKLEEAVLYVERNPKMVKSITSFPYTVDSM